MSFETYPQSVRLRLTLPEPDLREALLILYCYSCSEYDIKAAQSAPSPSPGYMQTGHSAVMAKVEITARCTSQAIPVLLDELALTFGHTPAFRAAIEID